MSKKLTPWFPGDVKPVRVGYYKRDWMGNQGPNTLFTNDFWNGEGWQTHHGGDTLGSERHSTQNLPWRGLAKKPTTRGAA